MVEVVDPRRCVESLLEPLERSKVIEDDFDTPESIERVLVGTGRVDSVDSIKGDAVCSVEDKRPYRPAFDVSL